MNRLNKDKLILIMLILISYILIYSLYNIVQNIDIGEQKDLYSSSD